MKKLLLVLILITTVIQGFSQSKGISYQAVILNPNPQEIPGQNAQGNIFANSAVSIQFTVINSSNNEEYQENHSTSTDKYGMINLLIGTGAPTGSDDFSDIFWDGTVKKLKVAIDFKGGSNFSPLSEQNLTYMPQPPTQETTIEIASNTAAIATEKTRALQAEQANATGISTLKTEQATQNAAIALNTAKTGITAQQTSEITTNNTKVGITPEQASTIGNTTGINTGDQDISGIAVNAGAITTLQGEQTTQNTAIALNTAKKGITSQQTSDINANNAKVVITTQQAIDITANNAKVGYTEALVSANADVAANTLKTGITTTQASEIIANTAKLTNATHTGDVTGDVALTIGTNKVVTTHILDANVIDAKIASVSASKLTGAVAITNGGTGATAKTASFDALSPMAAVGDIIYGGTNGTGTALPKGTAGQVLTINAGATAPEWKTPSTALNLNIGDSYQGGIIFWLDATGRHGLIAATADQSTGIKWYNGVSKLTGTTGDGLYAGAMNTVMIVAQQMSDAPTGNFAAKVCADYSVTDGGVTYGDWYLPSKYELNLLYTQKEAIGGFTINYYWSSTEFNVNNAWYQNFFNDYQYHLGKLSNSHVRAIRAF